METVEVRLKTPTLKDIAVAAEVSTAAVSKVLHGSGGSIRVSPERAQKIREIARKFNYRPNVLARNLRKSRTHTIGVLFENLAGLNDGPLYVSNLLDGVASVLFKNHYRLALLPEIDREDILGSLGDGQLDGVIWCKLARDDRIRQMIQNPPIPIVAFNADVPEPGSKTYYVNCDNDGGIELAFEHLTGLGHRQIAFLHEQDEANTPDCQTRRAAYERLAEQFGIQAKVFSWHWDLEGLAAELVRQGFSAAICWSESLAGRLMISAHSAGVTIPQQLSVVGFDSTQYCETTNPRLTAVKQPIREMAALAAQTLIDLISGILPIDSSSVFPCTFDVRASTCSYLKAEENP